MDGERMAPADALIKDRTLRDQGAVARVTVRRPKTVRWFIIMALLLAVVLGGLYGFNRFREHAITTFFANNKPPPAQISAVEVKTEAVPRFAPAIGSLAAVHQVTINPEIGGRVVKIFFEPGATVKAGDPLVQLNDAPERGDLASYEAQARLAEIEVQRSSQLAQRQFASRETLDQRQSQLDQARAMILKTEALIAQKLIRAPFAGKLGISTVNPGQYLNAGDKIVTLQTIDPIFIDFNLPQQQLPLMGIGQKVTLTTDAYKGVTFEGRVNAINPKVDTNTRNVQIEATIPNAKRQLLPGMFANVKVASGDEQRYLTLPQTAITYNPYGSTVFVVKASDKKDDKGNEVLTAQQVFVTAGPTRGDQVAILKGVEPGAQVVTSGQVKLKNGMPVKINNAVQPSDNPNPAPQEGQ